MDEDLERKLREHNGDALYQVKKLLRTRCPDSQLSAVRALESCLLAEPVTTKCPVREWMLEEDMVGFLCDAMATNSWPLLERVTSAVELLADCDLMLLKGHAVLAVEAAQRRAHFLALMLATASGAEAPLRAVLCLVNALLCRWSSVRARGRTRASLCPPSGLLPTLRLVLEQRSPIATETIMAAASTLCNLTGSIQGDDQLGGPSWDPARHVTAIALGVRASLRALEKVVQAERKEADEHDEGGDGDSVAEEACELICATAKHITSLRAACELQARVADSDWDDGALVTLEGVEAEAQQCVLERCLPGVVRASKASMEAAEDEDGRSQPAVAAALLDFLETSLALGRDPAGLADTLACEGFLCLLPDLCRQSQANGQSVGPPLRLLAQVLALLAHDLLDAASWWPAGPAELTAFLESARPELPADNREWPRVLGPGPAPPHSAAAAAQLLVMLLAYFRALAASDCDWSEHQALADSIPGYVMELPSGGAGTGAAGEAHTAPSDIKIVWLVFAVYCVLARDSLDADSAAAASARLVALLDRMQAGDLRAAFTHHHALVYWAFQARAVPPRLQQRVLELWLGLHEGDADAATTVAPVSEIVLAHPQAVHPLLDVVACGGAHAAAKASRILSQAAAGSAAVAEDLSAGLWERLPLDLSLCASHGGQDSAGVSHAAAGCGLLVWLTAQDQVFRPPAPEVVLRTASALCRVLGRRRFGSEPRHLVSAMEVLRKLLEDGRGRSDPRVHATLLNDAAFIQAIMDCAMEVDVQVRVAGLRLLRQLEEDGALLTAPVVATAVTLEVCVFLSAVSSTDLEELEAGVLLFLEVLKPKPHPFMVLERNEDFLRSVYFVLQNNAMKFQALPALGDAIWRLMRELLSASRLLSHQRWNNVLVTSIFRQTPLSRHSEACFAFVLEWLRLLTPDEPPHPTPRRPEPTMLDETLFEMATAISSEMAVAVTDHDVQMQTTIRAIARAITNNTANLPSDLEKNMLELARV